MATTTTVQKWGNSLGVRIPADIAKQLGIHDGARVQVKVDKGTLVIKPDVVSDLETLLKQTKRSDRPDVVDFGPPVGKEAI
jgi:antitoxin MazE